MSSDPARESPHAEPGRKPPEPNTTEASAPPARGSACMADGCNCPGYEDVHDSSSYTPNVCVHCGHLGAYHVEQDLEA